MLKNNYLYIFVTAFILKLAFEIAIGPGVFISLGVLFFFLLGVLVLLVMERVIQEKEVALPPEIQVTETKEIDILKDLERLLLEGGLELKLRRVDESWQVTLIRHDGSIIRIVGMGVAETIMDSLTKAEVNFLEKE